MAKKDILPMAANSVQITQTWQSQYKIDDNVEIKIAEGLWQKCIVFENFPKGILIVNCDEYMSSFRKL